MTDLPPQFFGADGWSEPAGKVHRCLVHLRPEADGFSAVAVSLPGVASGGETEAEALANITEAIEGVLIAYREQGMSVPWEPNPPAPESAGVLVRAVFVRGQ